MHKKLFISFILILLTSLIVTASRYFNISEQQLSAIENKYGSNAKKRVELWDSMLESSKDESVLNKIKNVNDFFNRITYKTDQAHWKKKDYWATPFEFMGTGAGDCEDYAIAKYFTLLELGIKKENLYFAVVDVKGERNSHMVLFYLEDLNSTPLVMDNLNFKVLPLNKRINLIPRFAFNELDSYKFTLEKFTDKVTVNWGKEDKWKKLLHRVYILNE